MRMRKKLNYVIYLHDLLRDLCRFLENRMAEVSAGKTLGLASRSRGTYLCDMLYINDARLQAWSGHIVGDRIWSPKKLV